MARTLKNKTSKIRFGIEDIVNLARQYAQNRTLRERAAKAEKKDKDTLMEIIAEIGEPTENGHRVYTLPEAIPMIGKYMTSMTRQRAEIKRLNEDRAEDYLRNRGLWDKCTTTVTILNEEAILALNFQETISDRDLESLYDTSEQFSFVPGYTDPAELEEAEG